MGKQTKNEMQIKNGKQMCQSIELIEGFTF